MAIRDSGIDFASAIRNKEREYHEHDRKENSKPLLSKRRPAVVGKAVEVGSLNGKVDELHLWDDNKQLLVDPDFFNVEALSSPKRWGTMSLNIGQVRAFLMTLVTLRFDTTYTQFIGVDIDVCISLRKRAAISPRVVDDKLILASSTVVDKFSMADPLDSFASLLAQTSSLPQNPTNDHPARIRMGSIGVFTASQPDSKTSPSKTKPLYSFRELRPWLYEEHYARSSLNQPAQLKRVKEGYVERSKGMSRAEKRESKIQEGKAPQKYIKESCEVTEFHDGRRRQVFTFDFTHWSPERKTLTTKIDIRSTILVQKTA